MWLRSQPKEHREPRLFPFWTKPLCNEFLKWIREETDATAIEEKSSIILKAAVLAKEQGRDDADTLFRISKLLSEAAYESAGTPDLILGVTDDQLIDVGMVFGMLQIGANTFSHAQEEWRKDANPEIAAVRCLIAREQLGICTAAIGINKNKTSLAAVVSQSKISSLRLFLDTHQGVRKIYEDFDLSWLGDGFKKKVALPLTLLVTHFLIVDNKPDPEGLFKICGICIEDSVIKCLQGRIEEVIASMENISRQISDA